MNGRERGLVMRTIGLFLTAVGSGILAWNCLPAAPGTEPSTIEFHGTRWDVDISPPPVTPVYGGLALVSGLMGIAVSGKPT